MKKQVSVFGLHTRAALNRLLLAALGLLAVELILAGVCIARGTALTLSGSRLETALQHSFRAGILALQVLLASSLGSNSRYGYTLQRLRVSERCVFLWSCVCNTLCFAVLWCVQIMAAVGAAFWNASSAGIRLARRACLWISTAAAFCMGFCRWQTGMYGHATHCSCWRWAA